MEIGLETAVVSLDLKAQAMIAPALDPVIDVGSKAQNVALRFSMVVASALDLQLNREEWRVIDDNSTLFHRRDQIIPVRLALEDRREQLDERRPPDR